MSVNTIDDKARAVLKRLKNTPYLCADEIAKKEDLTPGQLNTIYRVIRTSPDFQYELENSDNFDYFTTVQKHFGGREYTVVFFVGLYCPARCHFCPSVTIHENGFRELARYKSATSDRSKLSYDDLGRIFDDLRRMQINGYRVSVKISGGLEPFTDPKTVGWILEFTRKFEIHSTIFTNGMLLGLDKNRRLAARCDNLRISLSTSNEKSYGESYFGNHKDNKKVALLADLTESLRMLVSERNEIASMTEIGINTVAGEHNFHELEKLVCDASALGVDYVEIKSDYFAEKNSRWFDKLDAALSGISKSMANGRVGHTRVGLTGSLRRNNFFNNKPDGSCLPEDQAAHKIFINPFGECTPVHHWAYPRGLQKQDAARFLGSISEQRTLFHLIDRAGQLPTLDFAHLNPFELILSLESERRRRDKAFGIDDASNPYLQAENEENETSRMAVEAL